MTKLALDSSKVESRTTRSSMPSRDGGELLVAWRLELDSFYTEMEQFATLTQPDEIFRKLSAWTARVSHIRSQIVRQQSNVWLKFRTMELEPFLVECDRQFKFWSRNFSVYSLDWDMQKGQS